MSWELLIYVISSGRQILGANYNMSHHQVSCLKSTGYQLLRTLAVSQKKQLKSCSHRSGRCIKLLWGLWRLPRLIADVQSPGSQERQKSAPSEDFDYTVRKTSPSPGHTAQCELYILLADTMRGAWMHLHAMALSFESFQAPMCTKHTFMCV